MFQIKVTLSNRHIHVTEEIVNTLFGPGFQLTKGFAGDGFIGPSQQFITIVGPKGSYDKVRVMLPVRRTPQIEVSKTDCFRLGIDPPLGEFEEEQGDVTLKLIGPAGEMNLTGRTCIATRHIHMSRDDAARWGIEDRSTVMVETDGPRGVIFKNVLVKLSRNPGGRTIMHVDLDEGNAAGLKNNDLVTVRKA